MNITEEQIIKKAEEYKEKFLKEHSNPLYTQSFNEKRAEEAKKHFLECWNQIKLLQ